MGASGARRGQRRRGLERRPHLLPPRVDAAVRLTRALAYSDAQFSHFDLQVKFTQ